MYASSTGEGDPPLLRMAGIRKSFPGVRALDGVDLEVRAGEVHCLLGQNGAGKSTLIKTLSGAHQPDSGSITWRGEPTTIPTPVAALRLGIATMYQELDLIPTLSVFENIFLGHERARMGITRPAQAREQAAGLLARLGHPGISPDTEVGHLPAAGQQLVSMARALAHDAKLIVADEPTAALANDEVDNLFRIISGLTEAGVAVVYISHRMEEIRRIGDRVTVLKDGRTVAEGLDATGSPADELVDLMAGRKVESDYRPAGAGNAPFGETVLEIEGLSRPGEFRDVTFAVRAGEILGLAGLMGAGRSEVLETIAGRRRPAEGSVRVLGKRVRQGSVGAAVRAGIGLAPEERKSLGLLLDMSVTDNVTLASLGRYSRFGVTQPSREARVAASTLERLDLRPADPRRITRTLSGGNQQKVVVARWLVHGSRVLLLDEPTRGVDVSARAELYRLIHELAASGVAIVLVSSEIPEVLGLSDRILVLREGEVVTDRPAGELAEATVLDMVMNPTAINATTPDGERQGA